MTFVYFRQNDKLFALIGNQFIAMPNWMMRFARQILYAN